MPAQTVTLLHGFGGVGKTLLAQQICTAFAVNQPLFGGAVAGGGALLLAGEDDHDELWRRQVDICRRAEVSLNDCAEGLEILAAPHIDITMARTMQGQGVCPLPTFESLRQRIEHLEPALVVLDNAARLFDIDHSSNTEVNRAVSMLRSLCEDFSTSVVLLAHNSKSGDFFGSVQWENAVRSRLLLERDEQDREIILLKRPKANYASTDDGLGMRWDRGSFRAESPEFLSVVDRIAADNKAKKAEAAFLAFIDKRNSQGRPVSHSRQAPNYAAKEMLGSPDAGDLTRKQIEQAMERLFGSGTIIAGHPICQGADRHWRKGIARREDSSRGEGVESGG